MNGCPGKRERGWSEWGTGGGKELKEHNRKLLGVVNMLNMVKKKKRKERKRFSRDNGKIPHKNKLSCLLLAHTELPFPPIICKFMNYQIKYATFMDNTHAWIIIHAKGSHTISHSACLPRRIIINV